MIIEKYVSYTSERKPAYFYRYFIKFIQALDEDRYYFTGFNNQHYYQTHYFVVSSGDSYKLYDNL